MLRIIKKALEFKAKYAIQASFFLGFATPPPARFQNSNGPREYPWAWQALGPVREGGKNTLHVKMLHFALFSGALFTFLSFLACINPKLKRVLILSSNVAGWLAGWLAGSVRGPTPELPPPHSAASPKG